MFGFELAENPTEKNTPVYLGIGVSTKRLRCIWNRPSRYSLQEIIFPWLFIYIIYLV